MILDSIIATISNREETTLEKEYFEKEQQLRLLSDYFLSVEVNDGKTPPTSDEAISVAANKKLINEIFDCKKRMEFIETLPFHKIMEKYEISVLAVETSKGLTSFLKHHNKVIFEQ